MVVEVVEQVPAGVQVLDKLQEMGGHFSEKIELVLGKVAEKFGQGVDYFWPIFVRQQIVEGLAMIGLTLLGILFLVGLILVFKATLKRADFGESRWNRYATISLVVGTSFCLLTFAMTLGISSNINEVVTGLINPEYQALVDVIRMAHGL